MLIRKFMKDSLTKLPHKWKLMLKISDAYQMPNTLAPVTHQQTHDGYNFQGFFVSNNSGRNGENNFPVFEEYTIQSDAERQRRNIQLEFNEMTNHW